MFSSITLLNIIACVGVAKKVIAMDLKSYIPLFHSLIQMIIHNNIIISLLKCHRRFCSRFNKLVKFCNCQLTQFLPQKAQKLQKHHLPALKNNEKSICPKLSDSSAKAACPKKFMLIIQKVVLVSN